MGYTRIGVWEFSGDSLQIDLQTDVSGTAWNVSPEVGYGQRVTYSQYGQRVTYSQCRTSNR
jgi:hypothetical protein